MGKSRSECFGVRLPVAADGFFNFGGNENEETTTFTAAGFGHAADAAAKRRLWGGDDEAWDGKTTEEPTLSVGVYQIGTAEELAWFADHVNAGNPSANAVLTGKIDLNNQEWTPINGGDKNYTGGYTGIFDGQGHTISGLNVPGTDNNQGLFRIIGSTLETKGTLKNLIIADGTVTGGNNTGAITGQNKGIIENCINRATVTASSKSYFGGIAGQNTNGGIIRYCSNSGIVSAPDRVGGIAGWNNGGTIYGCSNSGPITGTRTAGGIAGASESSTGSSARTALLYNCYNLGNVTSSGTAYYAGGVCGQINQATTGEGTPVVKLYNCYNTGLVENTAKSTNVGEIIANDATSGKAGVITITNNYPRSQVSNTPAFIATLNLGTAADAPERFVVGPEGHPVLAWQLDEDEPEPPADPLFYIAGSVTPLYVDSSKGQKEATLTAVGENMPGELSDVHWSSNNNDAVTLVKLDSSDKILVKAKNGGTAIITVTANVEDTPYSETTEITVMPQITIVGIGGTVAAGQTVNAAVFILGNHAYDFDNYPDLTFQWGHATYEDILSGRYYTDIPGKTARTYTIPADWAGDYLTVSVGYAGQKLTPNTQYRIAEGNTGIVSADKSALTLDTLVIKEAVPLILPTSGSNGSAIAWSSSNKSIIADDGTVTLPESGIATVTLTATLTYEGAAVTKSFQLLVYSTSASEDDDIYLQAAADSLGSWYKLYPSFGTDSNVADMVASDLAAKGHGDVSVTVSNAKEVYGSCGIDENGAITYFYADPNGTRGLWFGRYDVAFTLSKGDSSLELPDVPVILYWDVARVKTTMTTEIFDKVTDAAILAAGDSTGSVTANLTLPKVVDDKKWTQIAWTSSDPGVISVSAENQTSADTLFDPYVGRVIRGAEDKTVTLTAAFTFQRANDVTGSEPPIVMHKPFTVTVKAISGDAAEAARAALLAKLDTGFTAKGLRDYVTGETLTPVGDIYTVSNDIQLPTTHDFGVDGKYYPVTITSSDEETIATPGVANAARVTVYRPPVGAEAKTVTLTVTLADKSNGISASKAFQISVSPLTQAEITAELALMDQVKAGYFNGIKSGNPSADNVTSNLRPFQEAYLDNGTLTWVYHVDDRVNHGIVPVALDGWYDLQIWRLFKSSNPAVVSHENLLVTRQANAKAVAVSSALSSEVYGKYGELYHEDPVKYAAYAALAPLYYQEVSANLTVRGTSDPGSTTPVEEKLTVSFTLQSASGTLISSTSVPNLSEGSTVFDVFARILREKGYDYASRGSYVYAVVTPDGAVLEELDEGVNSGWMYKVNGNIPSSYMAAYPLKNGDNIVVFFTRDYTQETGYPGGGWNQPVKNEHAEVTSKGDGTYSVTLLADATTASGGVHVSIPNVQSGQIVVVVNADGTETIVKKSMIKNGTAYLLLTQNATVKVVDASASFSDVKQGDWYSEAVDFVSSRRLFQGTTPEDFSPNSPMTRAMLVTVLFRLEDASSSQGSGFADVGAGAWYADAVGWASTNRIVGGHDDGSFAPNQSISRQQLATILYRYASSIGLDTSEKAELSSYPDQNRVADYAGEAMAWAVEAGLIQGRDGALSPEASASRAEVALILYRLMEFIVQ